MAKQKQLSQKYQIWIDARKRHKLSHAHIQMARELGMNPKKFGSLANHKQESWKLPLNEFIEKFKEHCTVRAINHYYFLGSHEDKRHKIVEALIIHPDFVPDIELKLKEPFKKFSDG